MDIFLHLYGLMTEGMLHAIDLLTPAPSEQALRACCVLRQTLLHAEEAYIHNPPPSDAPPILNRFSPQKKHPKRSAFFSYFILPDQTQTAPAPSSGSAPYG